MPRLWLAALLVLANWLTPAFGPAALHAQTARSLNGTVLDGATGDPLVGANVAVLDAEGAVVGGTSTNPDGRFSLRVEALPVELAIRYIGYETQWLDDASTVVGVGVARVF